MGRPNQGLTTNPDSKKIGVWFTAAEIDALMASAEAGERNLSQEVRLRIKESLKIKVDKI